MIYQPGMYVRFPFDYEYDEDPREFLMGQISRINELKSTAIIKTQDPFGYKRFYEHVQDEYEVDIASLERCTSGIDVHVKNKTRECVVLGCDTSDSLYSYFIQDISSKDILEVGENNIEIPFNCMDVSPLVQIYNYEFQNPVWYIGRSIVSKSMNVLNNSISGFSDLAGCKIELLAHQLMTIMRCLQTYPCRYMLADEVGMGKTIEAIGVVKIFCNTHANLKILILVPSALKEQWKTELLFKFDLSEKNDNNNTIVLADPDQLLSMKSKNFDFLIVDEAHHYLDDEANYHVISELSAQCENVLLLSATPVQEKGEAYLKLLRLLNPKQYNKVNIEAFEEVVAKQKKIVKQVHFAYSSLTDLIEQRDYLLENDLQPADDQDMRDLFDDLCEQLKMLGNIITDEKYNTSLDKVVFDAKNYSIPRIKALLVYVSERYQIDVNVIRNRRRLLKDRISERELSIVTHNLDESPCVYEKQVYKRLCENISALSPSLAELEGDIVPLLQAFFSSAAAFKKQLQGLTKKYEIDDTLLFDTESWANNDRRIAQDFITCMDEESHASRVCDVLELLNGVTGRDKVVLFTDFDETLSFYKECLEQYFGEECVAVYSEKMESDIRETNVYRFQYVDSCQFLLCDSSGGEGKNFQNARFVVHLDLPWDAVALEQRIGRLDRLGRDPEIPVISVVIFDENTVEESLFKVFNDGLQVFNHSLSGLEIVVKELNELLIKSLANDINFGLEESLKNVIDISSEMKEEIKAEQIYDVAGFEFKPLNRKISKSIQNLYSQNADILQTAMIGWSRLTGFANEKYSDGLCSFSSDSFSYGSAIKTLLIPPRWESYKDDERVAHIDRIKKLTTDQINNKSNYIQWIRGTFDRELAIKSDYLHFFAPGDPIFDCIVSNAMGCCKGRCSAIQITCGINWQGFILKFSNRPDYNLLYRKGVSREQCNQFTGYIDTNEIAIPYTIYNPENTGPLEVLKEFNRYLNPQLMLTKDFGHLGKRSTGGQIYHAKRAGLSNAEWFRETYKENLWKKQLDKAYSQSLEAATSIYKKKSRISMAKDEIDTLIAVKQNSSESSQTELEQEKEKYNLIVEALDNSVIELDTIAFVWLTKNGID